MSAENNPQPLIIIAGPTASGKSALALALSRHLPVTLINADASQVYSDLRIISARPDEVETRQAPHQLFGYVDGAQSCSAAQWSNDARAAIAEAHSHSRVPVLVGGTGLYLRTLIDGIAPVPDIDPIIRAEVRAMSVGEAYSALQEADAEAATRLNAADTTRIARALEVVRSTGRTLKDWQADRIGRIGPSVQIAPLILLPPRDWLFERCDRRFEAMMGEDGIAEVEALLARGLDPSLPVMRAIGVREIGAFLGEQLTRQEALAAGQLATRQYAKRQYTWFRNQPPAGWHRHESQLNDDSINDLAIKLRNTALTS